MMQLRQLDMKRITVSAFVYLPTPLSVASQVPPCSSDCGLLYTLLLP